jgi:hypothetical protein
MKKLKSIFALPIYSDKGECADLREWNENILIGKLMLPLLTIVICFSALALTFAWFKEFHSLDTQPVTVSSKYITTIYFQDFEREAPENRFRGQTGLGIKGTSTEADAPYQARFYISVKAEEDTPLPYNVALRIKSVTVKKNLQQAVALTREQIDDNFRVKLYNPVTLEENNTAYDSLTDFILIISYWGEAEGIPFEFSGIEYNGAEFTFAIDMYGEVIT